MALPRRFLITGATGKQGGAVVKSLLEYRAMLPPERQFEILCLSRKSISPKVLSLSSTEGVSVIVGDLFFPGPVFDKTGHIDGVFLMTSPVNLGDEEMQATAFIDTSIANGVRHFVFTSTDRGGSEVSEANPTDMIHFRSKYNIEKYLKEKCETSLMTWTILQPVGFMDNFTPNFAGKGIASMWESLVGDKPLQFLSVKDVGHFGAVALLDPESYQERTIGLAGDELTFKDADKIFKETMGYKMPRTWRIVESFIEYALPEFYDMFVWFREEGYGVDIERLREEYPELQDFKTWLQESSQYVPKPGYKIKK